MGKNIYDMGLVFTAEQADVLLAKAAYTGKTVSEFLSAIVEDLGKPTKEGVILDAYIEMKKAPLSSYIAYCLSHGYETGHILEVNVGMEVCTDMLNKIDGDMAEEDARKARAFWGGRREEYAKDKEEFWGGYLKEYGADAMTEEEAMEEAHTLEPDRTHLIAHSRPVEEPGEEEEWEEE